MGHRAWWAGLLLVCGSGCAIIDRLPGTPKRAPVTVTSESVDNLDQLPAVRTERVTVPTKVVRNLMLSEQSLREQLDAIKRVDLDGASKVGHP